MSAWLVSKGHIDGMVQALVIERLVPMEDATEIGKALWLENYKSLNARYRDDIPDEIDYEFEGIEAPLHDYRVSRAISCYNYQTCEHNAWGDPKADIPVRTLLIQLQAIYSTRNGVEPVDPDDFYSCISGNQDDWPTDRKAEEPWQWGVTDIKELITSGN